MENKELHQYEKDIYELAGHIFAISGFVGLNDFNVAEEYLSKARKLAEKLTDEIDNKKEIQFKDAQKRYQAAFESMISPESAILTPKQKLKEAFQIAAFGKVNDYKPEEHPKIKGNFDDRWLKNLN